MFPMIPFALAIPVVHIKIKIQYKHALAKAPIYQSGSTVFVYRSSLMNSAIVANMNVIVDSKRTPWVIEPGVPHNVLNRVTDIGHSLT
ncbi:hypothetical protein INT43_003701 [Umbelopsis isabellina]|uniref:Uncharacterized protein n=1 Tax=Mortierella isabellina TaxID=91625 RepID=A0A8H7UEE8_MORIS|nr:hypothetical protein INT43_003701 [Umbelopsis isabellina]